MRLQKRTIEKTLKGAQGYYYKAQHKVLESIVRCIEEAISQGKQKEQVEDYIHQLRKNNYAQEYRQFQLDKQTTIHLEKNHLCICTLHNKESYQKEVHKAITHAEYCLAKEGYTIISSQD